VQKKQLATLIDMVGAVALSKKVREPALSKNWLSKSEKWLKTFEKTFGIK